MTIAPTEPPHIRKPDRRIQRTRMLLRDALMVLIIEKGYDEITLQDIVDRADVARTTFYLHFKDKDDLLFSTMREMYEDLFNSFLSGGADPTLGLEFDLADPTDFEHVQKYADFYRVMLSERGSMSFYMRVQEYLARVLNLHVLEKLVPEGQTPRIPLEIIAYSCAGSQLAIIKWWLDHGMTYDARTMALMCKQMSLYGMIWSIDTTPVNPTL